MAKIAIIWDEYHRGKVAQFDAYFLKKGHEVCLVAENTIDACRGLDVLESNGQVLDAVFIGEIPGSDGVQSAQRQLANEFRVCKGHPRIISLLGAPDNMPGITWHDGFAGKDCTAEAALVIMNKLLESRENKDTIRHFSHV